jgi:hypothetical protein
MTMMSVISMMMTSKETAVMMSVMSGVIHHPTQ